MCLSWPWKHIFMTHEIQVWSVSKFHGNFMGHEIEWSIKFNFAYSWIFMAMKTDFHDPLISVLDHHQLFMALKKFSWAMK